MKQLEYKVYMDKVYGGWYGKCLGGAAGAPVEGIKKIIEVDDFTKIMNPDLPNDDLDLQLLWLDVLEQKGPQLDSNDLADAWIEKCWYPFSEYGYFIKNYKRGLKPPYSGIFNNPFFKEGMGCPIRSEIWGFVFPENPEKAAQFAKMDAVLDHGDNSVYAEVFLAVMESRVFTVSHIQNLILEGLSYIPKDCKLSCCIRMLVEDYNKGQGSWKEAREKVLFHYGHPDFTNVVQNLGFTVIALLYGKGNLEATINIALQCGYDTDCTCATAGAIIGAMIGYEALDPFLRGLIQDYFVCGIDVHRRSDSIKDLAEDTCRVGVSILEHCHQDQVRIVNVPDSVTKISWQVQNNPKRIEIRYIGKPAIGAQDKAEFEMAIQNPSDQAFSGTITIEDIPQGWQLENNNCNLFIRAKGEIKIANKVYTTKGTCQINNTNLMKAVLRGQNGEVIETNTFGLAGATIWKAYGPFYNQMDKQPNPSHPNPHGEGCVLPTVECMVNNEVYLDKEYIDEIKLDFTKIKPSAIINAYEDLIRVDETIHMEGQSCFYLVSEVVCPEEREVWAVIGNNDGFKLWVNGAEVLKRDEIRLWTPYNNCEIVKLQQGTNKIVLKVLRRTRTLEYSFAFRKYEGEHWHKKEWLTDLASKI